MSTDRPLPAEQGYRMAAEWEPHEATWLVWPKNTGTWPEDIDQAQDTVIDMIRCLLPAEKVFLLVDDADSAAHVRRRLEAGGIDVQLLEILELLTADIWIRDYGPNFVIHRESGKRAFNRWRFNGWGNKYGEMIADGCIPLKLEKKLAMPRFEADMVLEGGSVDVNGQGLCLATETCLLNPNRNPDMNRAQIEEYLRGYLGIDEVIWLGGGMAGDDTDGHVDNLARFVAANAIAAVWADDASDENHVFLRENFERLKAYRNSSGESLKVVKLPQPEPRFHNGKRLPVSYANFYIGNAAVLVPAFGGAGDSEAIQVLKPFFPDRQVIGIDCRVLIRGLGAMHCATQPQP